MYYDRAASQWKLAAKDEPEGWQYACSANSDRAVPWSRAHEMWGEDWEPNEGVVGALKFRVNSTAAELRALTARVEQDIEHVQRGRLRELVRLGPVQLVVVQFTPFKYLLWVSLESLLYGAVLLHRLR